MTCHEIQDVTVPYLELDLEPSRVRDVTAHLEGCAGCRAEMEAVRQVLVRVKGQTVPDPGDRFWDDFPDTVRLAVAREQTKARIKRIPASMPLLARSPHVTQAAVKSVRWPMALAATLLLFVGAWSLTGLFDQGTAPVFELELPEPTDAEWQQFWDEDPDLALVEMAAGLDHQAVERLLGDM